VPDLAHRGVFIAFEGIDGAGKTTQVTLLKDALERAGEAPITSKEPTSGPWGLKIRQSATNGRLDPDEELSAFIKDRTEHVSGTILPNLRAGKVVILDRYFYSTIAYQGSRGADFRKVKADMEERFPIPDLVFLLDIEPAVSVKRISEYRNEVPNEFEQLENLARAREIFNVLDDPHIVRVDGTLPREAVHSAVLSKFVFGPLKSKRCAANEGCSPPLFCAQSGSGGCQWFMLSQALGLLKQPATR
jgi:dTMP kinase